MAVEMLYLAEDGGSYCKLVDPAGGYSGYHARRLAAGALVTIAVAPSQALRVGALRPRAEEVATADAVAAVLDPRAASAGLPGSACRAESGRRRGAGSHGRPHPLLSSAATHLF